MTPFCRPSSGAGTASAMRLERPQQGKYPWMEMFFVGGGEAPK